jgi:hypothetical protein
MGVGYTLQKRQREAVRIPGYVRKGRMGERGLRFGPFDPKREGRR